MNTRRLLPFASVSAFASLTACATLAHGTQQAVPVTSSTPGASVTVDGVRVGVTPLTVELKRGQEHLVQVASDSAAPVDVRLMKELSGWIVGSVVLYLVPALIDVGNGAAYNLSPRAVHVAFPAALAADATAATTGIRRPIPVLDDFGQVIPEHVIAATMREGSGRKAKLFAVALMTGLSFYSIVPKGPNGADCSIYEPCTPREKFYRNKSFVVGVVAGFMFGYGMIPDNSVDRWQAVQIIRAQRRYQRNATTPP